MLKNFFYNYKVIFSVVVFAFLLLSAISVFAFDSSLIEGVRGDTSIVGQTAYGEKQDSNQLTVRIAQIIQLALTLIGIVVVIIMVYAGFMWMTAGGNQDQVKKAKQWMFNAVIGLIITFSAYAITDFVLNRMIDYSMVEFGRGKVD